MFVFQNQTLGFIFRDYGRVITERGKCFVLKQSQKSSDATTSLGSHKEIAQW